MLGNDRVYAESSGALATDQIVSAGVRGKPDVNAIAARREHDVEILVWNYHDDDLAAPDTAIELLVQGLPDGIRAALSEHFRVDAEHSNSFSAWQAMGSPQNPSASQYRQLESAGQLQLLESPAWIPVDGNAVRLQFALPRQGMSLLRLAW
jgi:xylan 1,4-beta-xylosidase